MESRQFRMLLILAAALAVMILVLVLLDAPEAPGEEGMADRLALAPSEVSRFHLTTAGGTAMVERAEDGWWVVEPLRARGDDVVIEGLLGAFDRLQTTEVFEDVDPADFGLDTPAARLTVTLTAGGEHTLLIGAEATVGRKTYVDVDGQGVRAANGLIADNIALSVDLLRDARIHTFAASAVTALRWEAEGEGWTLERRGEGWRLGDGRRAATSTIEGHLAGLGALKMSTFLSTPQATARGLDTPPGVLVLVTTDGEDRIEVGREAADGVALRTPTGATGLLDSLDALRPYLGDLLEPRLLPVAMAEGMTLTVALGDREALFEAGPDSWLQAGAAVEEERAGRISQFLATASADRAVVLERGPEVGSVLFTSAEGETLRVVLGPETGAGRVGWEEEGPPFLIPVETVALLESLLELTLEPPLE